MFVCLECYETFEEPVRWSERHGLDTPPYEYWSGSPCCHSNYVEAHECGCCGEIITTDKYVEIDGQKYCWDCVTIKKLEEI